ncbi:hypothetical protein [Nitrincola alkalilacustris]|uniref:hypothetical protein n=1 Tax=Nitrincola alkalilacustris TaxID=1571224 RepID=UPI00124CAED6|nr:hypothetical protein [Nitrincola alkalilacustris]
MTEQQSKTLHHLATAAGFLFLILWFYTGRRLGFLDWFVTLGPMSHAGATLTIGIMLMMLPAFLIWKYCNRWIEKRLKITGRFFEDEVYQKPDNQADHQGQDKENRQKQADE